MLTRDGLTTVALNPGTLRHPSPSSCMPSRSTNSGLTNTSSDEGSRPTETSTTKMRSGMPICGAASPTPGAAYIVSIMSSISRSISGVSASTGCAGACSAWSPYLRMGLSIQASALHEAGRRPIAERSKVLHELLDGIAAELLDRGVGEHESHHRLADH